MRTHKGSLRPRGRRQGRALHTSAGRYADAALRQTDKVRNFYETSLFRDLSTPSSMR